MQNILTFLMLNGSAEKARRKLNGNLKNYQMGERFLCQLPFIPSVRNLDESKTSLVCRGH
jgi:hypothetical protein